MPAAPSRTPRVIFINRFYRPDEPATAQLLTDLAESLAARGHAVVVIARHPGSPAPREETINGVRVLRVRGTRQPRGGLIAKAVDFASFYAGAMLRLIRVAQKGDALVALTDPPLLGIGVWICARWRRARLFHWVQDIYPELAIEVAGQRWLQLFRPLRNAAWRGAEHGVTLGHDMAAVLAAARVPQEKISIVPNWAPAGLVPLPVEKPNELRAAWGLAEKFVVAYSGNFGRVHDLASVLAVAAELREESEIAFVLIGDGAQRRVLEALALEQGLSNLIFRPPQPRAQLEQTLALADIHLVTLRAGCERFVFPSKLYGVAAVGRPVIFIGPKQCEVARIVESGGFGGAFEPADAAAIVAAIRALKNDPSTRERMARAAVDFSMRGGGARAAAARWSTLLAPTRELAAPSTSA